VILVTFGKVFGHQRLREEISA